MPYRGLEVEHGLAMGKYVVPLHIANATAAEIERMAQRRSYRKAYSRQRYLACVYSSDCADDEECEHSGKEASGGARDPGGSPAGKASSGKRSLSHGSSSEGGRGKTPEAGKGGGGTVMGPPAKRRARSGSSSSRGGSEARGEA